MPTSCALACAVVLVFAAAAGCGRGSSEAIRTPLQASEAAQRTLRAAGLDELVVSAEREDGNWLVTTRWRETPRAGHLVTIDAASGRTTVERYRMLELAGPRPAD